MIPFVAMRCSQKLKEGSLSADWPLTSVNKKLPEAAKGSRASKRRWTLGSSR